MSERPEPDYPDAVATEKAVIDGTTVDGAPVTDTHAATEAHGGAEAHAAPAALGMDATMWVALAMLVVIALFIWKKVPAMIGAALDKQIDGIKAQLDQAPRPHRRVIGDTACSGDEREQLGMRGCGIRHLRPRAARAHRFKSTGHASPGVKLSEIEFMQ